MVRVEGRWAREGKGDGAKVFDEVITGVVGIAAALAVTDVGVVGIWIVAVGVETKCEGE